MDFPIFPWDRKRPRQHLPQAHNSLDWQGANYNLRALNGLLFLRAIGQAKTFVVATPLTPQQEGDAANLPLVARAALERGDIARYVLGYDGYIERSLPLFFRADGTGFCRESWNRDDLPFEYFDNSISMHEWMEGDDQILVALTDKIGRDHLHAQLSALDEYEHRELEWICGSLEELTKLTRWICHLESVLWDGEQNIKVSFRSENEFGRACFSGWEVASSYDNWLSLHVDELSDQLEISEQGQLRASARLLELFDLALDENTPTGLGWEYHDYGVGRCANEPEPEYFEIEVVRPTAHEIAEAGVNLRAWLQGKMTRTEMDELLDNGAPAALPERNW